MCVARRKSWSADSLGMLLQKIKCIAVAAAIDATGPQHHDLPLITLSLNVFNVATSEDFASGLGGKHVQSTVLTNAPLQSGGC